VRSLRVSVADLHLHSTASDGSHVPAEVVALAAEAGLEIIALTDHDTVGGLKEARAAADIAGIRVISGCEFSVAAPWGEMHLLGYFLPEGDDVLGPFLATQREARSARMREIVRRLQASGARVELDAVLAQAGGDAVGRPHAARALLDAGHVRDVNEAFYRYLGRGRPAFVPKDLPPLETVTALTKQVGGVTSAAHLRERATPAALQRLKEAGVDAVEVRHPAHSDALAAKLETLVPALGMLRSGGTDWHGEREADTEGRAPLGAITIPATWVDDLEALHRRRVTEVV
jgi:3',5'-nucleoside bisphosphate phosphatase